MKWYNGGISDAVSYSKSKGAIFVVYIEGSDENSQKISNLIDNGELGQKLEQDQFVAVKLKAGSTSHQHFSEIYKEPSVPSIYFIGKNGVPLDIITGNTNLDNVSARIDDIQSRANIDIPSAQSTSAPVLSENFIKNEQSNRSPPTTFENNASNKLSYPNTEDELNQGEPVAASLIGENPLAVEDKISSNEGKESLNEVKDILDEVLNDIAGSSGKVKVPSTDDAEEKKEVNSNPSEVDLSVQEKVDRAKELIESKRQHKEKEEQENERLKELERRKMGQNVQQLKKWQEDQELKQLIEDRDREKRENQLARERVLAQIAQDRAERLSKFQTPSPKATETPKVTPSPPKPASHITRLQFKLPDGSSVTKEFQNFDTLEYVVSFVRSDLHFHNFTLATTFPRKEFTKNDYPSSLLDLQLVPNAVILILPTNSNVATHSEGGIITTVFWTVLSPIFTLFGYIKSWVFGSNSSRGRRNTTPPPNEPAEPTAKGTNQRKAGGDSTVVRRQGNIHRLTDRRDSDDENSTYNGNSTQQM